MIEMQIFLMFMTAWLCICFVILGVIVGDRMGKGKSCEHNCDNSVRSESDNVLPIDLRDDNGKRPIRQSRGLRYKSPDEISDTDKAYQPNVEEMMIVLDYFMVGGTSYERKVLWAIRERVGAERLEDGRKEKENEKCDNSNA